MDYQAHQGCVKNFYLELDKIRSLMETFQKITSVQRAEMANSLMFYWYSIKRRKKAQFYAVSSLSFHHCKFQEKEGGGS